MNVLLLFMAPILLSTVLCADGVSVNGLAQANDNRRAGRLIITPLPQKEYEQLCKRLAVFPELLKFFVELHDIQSRSARSVYAKRRIAFNQAVARYELSPVLLDDLKRFNKKMRPRIYRVWWKKKGFWVPVTATAGTGLALAAAWYMMRGKNGDIRQDEPLFDSIKPVLDPNGPASGVVYAAPKNEVSAPATPEVPVVFTKTTTEPAGAGSAVAPVAASDAREPITVESIQQHIDNLTRNPGGIVMVDGQMTFPDIPFFMEFVKPDNEVAWGDGRLYENKSFSYQNNHYIWPMRAEACKIALALAQASSALSEQIIKTEESLPENRGKNIGSNGYSYLANDDVRIQAIVDNYLIITHMFMCFEQEETSAWRDYLKTFFSADLITEMVKVTRLHQCSYIVESFSNKAGLRGAAKLGVSAGIRWADPKAASDKRKVNFDYYVLGFFVSGPPGLKKFNDVKRKYNRNTGKMEPVSGWFGRSAVK